MEIDEGKLRNEEIRKAVCLLVLLRGISPKPDNYEELYAKYSAKLKELKAAGGDDAMDDLYSTPTEANNLIADLRKELSAAIKERDDADDERGALIAVLHKEREAHEATYRTSVTRLEEIGDLHEERRKLESDLAASKTKVEALKNKSYFFARYDAERVAHEQTKAELDKLRALQKEGDDLVFLAFGEEMICRHGKHHKIQDVCHYCLAEQAEAELAALKARITDIPDLMVAMDGDEQSYLTTEDPQWDEEYQQWRTLDCELGIGCGLISGLEPGKKARVALVVVPEEEAK